MKNFDEARAASIDDHNLGLADRLVSSRNTRIARSRFQGLTNRWSALWRAGASLPSRAWL
jgi:hypothetical protein